MRRAKLPVFVPLESRYERWSSVMNKAWLLLVAATAVAADDPRIVYSKTFPGSTPAYFEVTIDRTGAATYNESQDADNAEKLQIEQKVTREIFDLAQRLDHFKNRLESGLKVANMGQKVLRWEDGAERHESKFNYSTSEDAKALAEQFEHISESARLMLELGRVMKHDRLGVNEAMLRIQVAWDNKRLVGTAQLLPLLDQVANNESFVHMARERAALLAEAIRAVK
jgi:hypothetical protein